MIKNIIVNFIIIIKCGSYLNAAVKLLRLHHETLDTLEKYRGRSNQTVRVEHVHVNAGGQAIVGEVHAGGVSKNGGITP